MLNSAPTADVTIDLSTSDDTEGTPSPATLTFTTDNFAAPQTVTVTGVDDDLIDGNQIYMIVTGAASSSDPEYDGVDVADVTLTNVDNDSAGIIVTPTTGLVTSETGATDTFTVVLQAEPTADVVIDLEQLETPARVRSARRRSRSRWRTGTRRRR